MWSQGSQVCFLRWKTVRDVCMSMRMIHSKGRHLCRREKGAGARKLVGLLSSEVAFFLLDLHFLLSMR